MVIEHFSPQFIHIIMFLQLKLTVFTSNALVLSTLSTNFLPIDLTVYDPKVYIRIRYIAEIFLSQGCEGFQQSKSLIVQTRNQYGVCLTFVLL